MSTVFVLGATGGVGSRVVSRLVQRGDRVLGLHRRRDQGNALRAKGVEPVAGDLTAITSDDLAAKLSGVDAIVFTAGAPDAGTKAADAVDGRGVEIAVAAADAAGVRRFLLVSAFPDAWRDRRMPAEFEHYMKVKRQADVRLAESLLDWVILRPGTLTDRPGTGRVRLGPAIPYGEVTRDDVAAVFAELVHAPGLRRAVLELTNGNVPIEQAVTMLQA